MIQSLNPSIEETTGITLWELARRLQAHQQLELITRDGLTGLEAIRLAHHTASGISINAAFETSKRYTSLFNRLIVHFALRNDIQAYTNIAPLDDIEKTYGSTENYFSSDNVYYKLCDLKNTHSRKSGMIISSIDEDAPLLDQNPKMTRTQTKILAKKSDILFSRAVEDCEPKADVRLLRPLNQRASIFLQRTRAAADVRTVGGI